MEVTGVEFSSGLLLGFGVALVLWMVFRSTTFGYMVRSVGGSEKAGSYAGINVRLLSVAVLLLSGGVAGVAGVAHMTGGDTNAYATSLSNNTGYLGIAVAVLAGGIVPGGRPHGGDHRRDHLGRGARCACSTSDPNSGRSG